MFAVMRNFEAGDANRADAVDQRRKRTIAFAGKLHWLVVAEQSRPATDGAVMAFGFKAFERPWRVSFDVFAPEHGFEFRAADFTAKPIDFVVGNWTKLTLHFLWNLDAEFAFQQISDAAFAGLAIDADHLAVFAPNVGWIDGEIRNIPMIAAAVAPFGKTLANRILMGTAERGEDQFASIRLASGDGHAGATLIDFANGVEILKIELRVDAVHVEIQ